ncbi:MAG: hypothetical protein AAF230_02090 [Pseudomonadota bacterium]
MRCLMICLALLTAGPVNALSCLRPDAVTLFERARDATDDFYIVKGRITLLEAPNTPPRGSSEPALTRARVQGHALNTAGFSAPFQRDVILKATCVGPWCGSLDGLIHELLMAVEVSGETLTLNIGPCGGDQLRWDQSGEERLLTCQRSGACQRADK